MATSSNNKKKARQYQVELGVNYTGALRAIQSAPEPGSAEERRVAQDSLTEQATLHVIARRELSGYSDGFNHEDVAANPATPAATLRWLADGPALNDSWVQDKLLTNPSTPEDILRRFMLRDEHSRECLAKNTGAGDAIVMDVIDAEPKNHAAEYWASNNVGLSAATRTHVDRLRTVDSWKRYVDEEEAEKLRSTYRGWLSLQKYRQDPVGDLARDADSDGDFPSFENRDDIDEYFDGTAAYQSAKESWAEYFGQGPSV